MRVYRDLDLVEQLGSGMNRILDVYSNDIYKFSDNFIEVCFYYEKEYDQVTQQATQQATRHDDNRTDKIMKFCIEPKSREEIQVFLKLKDREYLRKNILNPLIKDEYLKLTIPEKPKSPKQKYYSLRRDSNEI